MSICSVLVFMLYKHSHYDNYWEYVDFQKKYYWEYVNQTFQCFINENSKKYLQVFEGVAFGLMLFQFVSQTVKLYALKNLPTMFIKIDIVKCGGWIFKMKRHIWNINHEQVHKSYDVSNLQLEQYPSKAIP